MRILSYTPSTYSQILIRDQLHAEGLATVKFVHIDVTDSTTIHAAKETIEKAEQKLDALVNNAGISNLCSVSFEFGAYQSLQVLPIWK